MAPSRSRASRARSRGRGRSRGAVRPRRGRQNALLTHLKDLSEEELILNGLVPETLAKMTIHSQAVKRGKAGSKRGITQATLNQIAKGLLANVSSGPDNNQMSHDESLDHCDTGSAGDSRSVCCDNEPDSPSNMCCSDIGSNSPEYGSAANESLNDMDLLLPTIPWFMDIKDKEYNEHDAIEDIKDKEYGEHDSIEDIKDKEYNEHDAIEDIKDKEYGEHDTIEDIKDKEYGEHDTIEDIKDKEYGEHDTIEDIKDKEYGEHDTIEDIKDKEYGEHDTIEDIFERSEESLLAVDQERSVDKTSTHCCKAAFDPSLNYAEEETVKHEVEDIRENNENDLHEIKNNQLLKENDQHKLGNKQQENKNDQQEVENSQQKNENDQQKVEKMDKRSEPNQVDLPPEDLLEVVRSQIPSMTPELLERLQDVLQKDCPLKDMVQTFARITQPSRKRNNKITSYFPKTNRLKIDGKINNGTERESKMNDEIEDGAAHAEERESAINDATEHAHAGLNDMEFLAKSCRERERPSWDVAGSSHDVSVPWVDDDTDLHSDASSPRVPTPQDDDDDLESLFPSITIPQKVSPEAKRIKTESNSSPLQGRGSKRGWSRARWRGLAWGRGRGGRRRSDDVAEDSAQQDLFSSTLNELLSAASTPPPRDLPAPRGPTETNEGEDEEEEMGVAATYADYVPAKLKIGRLHPDPVVETSSLSSVDIADITYQLRLPDDTIEQGLLSALQLEAVVYASQAHDHVLPDGMRAGFLVGDGAGVGKGRTIAGIIFENYLAGRKRAVWVSVSNDLKYDAERDLRDIGAGDNIQVYALNKMNYHSISSAKQVTGSVTAGVVFSTYSALIGHTSAAGAEYRKRLDQLVAWCGPDFEGCIVFDESHRAKNLCPTTATNPTETGKAVLQLQLSLPKARVVYASATGASEPRNMAYMVRLGLWGEGTPFHTFKDFLNAVEKRGVGAMEIVAMDMKLRGMYIARQLSFHGVTFKIEEVPLSQPFRDTYDKAVDLWVKAKKDFEVAVDMVDASKKWRRVMWAQFWAAHQRFFKYLCIAAKVSRAVQCTKDAVGDGKCVVVGLQSTGEARTLDQLERDRGHLHQFICTAKGVFTSLVEKQFPCPNNMAEPDDYAKGLPSVAVEETTNDMRERLLEDIAVLAAGLPPNTLDQLIDHLGGPEHVAEMTGRKGRVVQTETGKIKYESRIEADVPLETINLTEKQRFMEGEKDVAIISEAASSGISLQSDKRVKNQKRRVHITLELPWSADRAIQQFGRTHRSNQVNAPEYIFLISDLAGERRFASTVAKRLESLGALTHGDRRATETRDLSQFNIENKHGRAALRRMLQVIYGSEPPLPSVVPPPSYPGDFLKDAAAALADVGLEVGPEGSNSNIPRFLNRLLGVKVQLQNALFLYFSDTFDAVVQEAKRNGRFDLGILDLGAAGQCVRRVGRVRYLRTHATGQAPVELHTLHLERGFEWEKAVKKLSERGDLAAARVDPDEGFYLSRQRFSNNYNAILCLAHSTNRDHVGRNRLFNVYRPNLGLSVRPELLSDLVSKYARCPEHAAAPAWRAHYLHSLATCSHAWWRGHCGNIGCEVGMRTRTYYVLSGSVLAVWALLEAVYKRLHLVNKMQVVRIKTDHGLKIVGTLIPKYCVELLKEELRTGAVSVEEDHVST